MESTPRKSAKSWFKKEAGWMLIFNFTLPLIGLVVLLTIYFTRWYGR